MEMYEKDREIVSPKAKMTKSGDTVLHVAAVHGAEDFVTKLFDEIKSKTNNEEYLRILSAKNKRGHTPLHYAASRGSLVMCKSILSDGYFYSLAHLRNCQGETPLFLAALHGHKETFLYLHWVNITFPSPSGLNLWRRTDGDTILHCTLAREYFGNISHHHLLALINFSLIKYSYFLFDYPYSILTCTWDTV